MNLRKFVALGAVVAAMSWGTTVRAADGAALFLQNCAMCHQSGAVGLPGAFPRLAGRVAAISAAPLGRTYLIDVLTYGLSGKVTVDGQDILGLMPPFAQIPDEDVAAILSYVQTLGTPAHKPPVPFTAEEVTAGRAKTGKSMSDTKAERAALEGAKGIK